MRKSLIGIIRLIRPKQWLKNIFVLAVPVYAGQIFEPESLRNSIEALFLFCGLSAGVYIFNDFKDRERDRLHPAKRDRPLASGTVSPALALPFGFFLLVGSLVGCAAISTGLLAVAGIYLLINVLYTVWWKHVVILDILCVAFGFVLRVVAGGFAVGATIRPWILLCTLCLALLISLGKRRGEIALLGDGAADHRKILGEYPAAFLDILIVIVSGMTLMTYCLFTFYSGHSERLMVTIPFVLYGVFRYLYLLYVNNATDAPEALFLRDKPLLVNSMLWAVVSASLFN
jgi:4-hydroxybenzoate polyprenyltransferase